MSTTPRRLILTDIIPEPLELQLGDQVYELRSRDMLGIQQLTELQRLERQNNVLMARVAKAKQPKDADVREVERLLRRMVGLLSINLPQSVIGRMGTVVLLQILQFWNGSHVAPEGEETDGAEAAGEGEAPGQE